MKYDKFGYIEDIRSSSSGSIKELEMMKKFKSYNIIRERVEIYKDFTINLLYYIYDTYLGKDYIKTEKDMRGHFTWCYGKVLDEFYDEEEKEIKLDSIQDILGIEINDEFETVVEIARKIKKIGM